MAYTRPPTIAAAILQTNAIAGTTNSPVVIAAPGVGSRIRVVGFHCSLHAGVAAPAAPVTLFPGTTGGTAIGPTVTLVPAGTTADGPPIPEPGIIWPDNTAVAMVNISGAAASVFFWYWLAYYIDQVT